MDHRAGRRPHLVGEDQAVPLVDGSARRYINLDYAASTPALVGVADAVAGLLPWYSSVHRGAGFKSQVSTGLYEAAREAVRSFLRVPADDAVIFTRNTTDALNLLAACLPDDAEIVSTAVEHHANMLPWRRRRVTYIAVPDSPEALLERLDAVLRDRSDGRTLLVSVTGASNVTGELWPIDRIAALAHAHGARIVVDAAQLAPHAPIDMEALDLDYLACSGHKMYAPFGAGVLAGRADWLAAGDPFLRGGGAVHFVTLDDVAWRELPDRQEAGSPNVIGAVAMGVACTLLGRMGMDRVAREEAELHAAARARLATVPGLTLYTTWGAEHPHIGLLTFALEGYAPGQLAAILSAEYGIGVRHGCFCAHPLLLHLLGVGDDEASRIRAALVRGEHPTMPGAVRASMGLGSTIDDVGALAAALERIALGGPRWTYAVSPATGEWVPEPDPRPLPDLPLTPHRARRRFAGESS